MIKESPDKIIGDDKIKALKLVDGSLSECEVIMSDFGVKLNDEFLSELPLKKDGNFRYVTNRHYESSVAGLYIVGPLNTGNDQAIIAAGEGAIGAIDIKSRLLKI